MSTTKKPDENNKAGAGGVKRIKKSRKPGSVSKKLQNQSRAMVSTAHPLATDIGIDVLQEGGNFIDAAIAVAAALNVVDMSNTGIGGDAFTLVYSQREGRVIGLNASGRSPFEAGIEKFRRRGRFSMPERGPLSITTPGALSGWAMLHERYGTIPFARLLQPAIRLARDGFEIDNFTAIVIALARRDIERFPGAAAIYLRPDASARQPGEMLRQPELAESLETVASEGAAAMYGGPLGKRIAESVRRVGGVLSERDFAEHTAEWVEPIRTEYRGHDVFTAPPNSQGLALLEMLNIMEGYDAASFGPGDAELFHLQIEAKKLAFEDRNGLFCDPDFFGVPIKELLSMDYAKAQRERINPATALEFSPSDASGTGDTTYFCVVDSDGNAVSFINSLFHSFGSCVVAGDTGIIMQNRGYGFSFDPSHPNSLQPHKRPMHTLVPCMVFKKEKPHLVLGCIGGDQQPQGLLQILMNIIDFGMSPQEAIDAPRFRSYEGGKIALEALIGPEIVRKLSRKGHLISDEADFFGGSQCIMFSPDMGLMGGSDPRLAGCWRGLPQ